MFTGAMTAMTTPFRGGQIDYDLLTTQVRFQIESGIDGLVPMGTTGESPTLSHEEHRQVIEHVVREAKKANRKVPVIAGTGSNSTAEALELTAHAAQVGADGALMVNPYYNKPTQEGLYRHFATIADQVRIPIVLYNIPGRTGITMSPQTVARLNKHSNIVGIKEATGSLDIASEIASLCGITILSGDDSLTLPLMSIGGKGVISVLSNIIPGRVKALTAAALSNRWDEARRLHLELFPLFKGMFIETNPIPIKTAMAMMKKDTGELRLPMCELSEGNRRDLEKLLRDHRLL
ncbi:MAG: 4-hydroxy-tetrahydrodipicolinate synthase [Phycisphaeraceae bacterium]|nr:4-hydroxy-tetrahydrodipicolinate synthase [Phycisphaeraceae bacterium]